MNELKKIQRFLNKEVEETGRKGIEQITAAYKKSIEDINSTVTRVRGGVAAGVELTDNKIIQILAKGGKVVSHDINQPFDCHLLLEASVNTHQGGSGDRWTHPLKAGKYRVILIIEPLE